MNRRGFLKAFGIGAATVVAATSLEGGISFISEPELIQAPVLDAYIVQYADYTNFSEFAISEAIDEYVLNAATELARSEAMRINSFVSLV